jgi:hypothetical protein
MTMFVHPLLATVMCIVSVMHGVRIAQPGVARARPHAGGGVRAGPETG